MSLIERALQKARESGDAAPTAHERASIGSTPKPSQTPEQHKRTTAAVELPRIAAAPDLTITEAFLREKGLRAPTDQEQQQRAEYRHIKHGLFAEFRNTEMRRLVLVTSALQGDGKSYSAAHLSLSLAVEPDHTILLVDADVIRPNVSRAFGLSDRPGLMDAVGDESMDVQSLIVTTSIEGFSILPAGRPNQNATEYFASARMHEVMEQLLAVPNRIVVVDSLPLLLTTEARALASLAGQILLVVRAEITPQSAVLKALELLGESANVKLLLNAVVHTKALDYLGLGYGYNYYNVEK